MTFTETALKGSYIIEPDLFEDNRGWFYRYYCKDEYRQIGHQKEWVQCNHSYTAVKGTVRGMHFQVQPFREIKMVRCTEGAVLDVIVDLRKDSVTRLQWVAVELNAANKKILYIPEGFAHGFQALTDNCEMLYHHSEIYNRQAEAGIRYDDPAIKVEWSLPVTIISDKDARHPYLDDNFKGI